MKSVVIVWTKINVKIYCADNQENAEDAFSELVFILNVIIKNIIIR